jgi:hypothetical protein
VYRTRRLACVEHHSAAHPTSHHAERRFPVESHWYCCRHVNVLYVVLACGCSSYPSVEASDVFNRGCYSNLKADGRTLSLKLPSAALRTALVDCGGVCSSQRDGRATLRLHVHGRHRLDSLAASVCQSYYFVPNRSHHGRARCSSVSV